MPRPRRDGTAPREEMKCKLTELFIRKIEPRESTFLVWDTHQRGLAIRVQPTGHRSWACIYSANGRPRWFTIGAVNAIGLAEARKLAGEIMYRVAQGTDPCADRKAKRTEGTFEEVYARYVEYAKTRNRSWTQADALVRKHLMPRWSKLRVTSIARQEVKAAIRGIEAPIVANQSLAAASAVFTWAVREDIVAGNPCAHVERNPTKSRSRVLSETELPRYWKAFDDAGLYRSAALKTILLTAQRPGEVRFMRREHVSNNWWTLPGRPIPALRWPGTKNSRDHRVWLSPPVQALLEEIGDDDPQIFRGVQLDGAMRSICAEFSQEARELGASQPERVTPHDLRRTSATTIAALGYGRQAVDRILNHADSGVGSIYDRYNYAAEDRQIMEALSEQILKFIDHTS